MYRIFCESFNNYTKEFEQCGAVDENRYLIALPLMLILNLAYWDSNIA